MPRRFDPTADRECRSCKRVLPAEKFYASGTGNGRRRICIFCVQQQNKEKAGFERHERYNRRGEVWCNNCKKYLHPDHFKRHPSRPGIYWAYCKECVRIIDRMRYRAKAKTPAGKEATRRRTIRARRQRAGELRERIHFVLNSLDLLGRRGFTVSEISKLLRVALGQIYHWRSGASVPTPAIAERCIEILIATSHIPTGTDRAYRRRLPHPELITVLERTAGLDERHPVRNRWRARV